MDHCLLCSRAYARSVLLNSSIALSVILRQRSSLCFGPPGANGPRWGMNERPNVLPRIALRTSPNICSASQCQLL
eukprot:2120687-Pyramimonas_sp.AAC.1